MSTEQQQVGVKELAIPDGITVSVKDRVLTVKGPKGTASKVFSKVHVNVDVDGKKARIIPFTHKKKDVVSANTMGSIIRNLINGVTKGYEYRMKVVFAHFPVTVKVKGDTVVIENFVGERSPRLAKIVGECKVSVEGDDIVIKGVSVEEVGQTAANIEQATKIKRKDQRIFLDGIYVFEKKRG